MLTGITWLRPTPHSMLCGECWACYKYSTPYFVSHRAKSPSPISYVGWLDLIFKSGPPCCSKQARRRSGQSHLQSVSATVYGSWDTAAELYTSNSRLHSPRSTDASRWTLTRLSAFRLCILRPVTTTCHLYSAHTPSNPSTKAVMILAPSLLPGITRARRLQHVSRSIFGLSIFLPGQRSSSKVLGTSSFLFLTLLGHGICYRYSAFSDLAAWTLTSPYQKGTYHKHGMFLCPVIFSILGVLDGLEPQRISSHAQHHMHQSSHPIFLPGCL
ncbi:hypothetical protein HDV63DRAFT_295023 [Trichoderma sp. SZMC 28014]